MATAHGVSSINLLPRDSFEFSKTGKILKWATTVGRVLVVLTEFVVLLAFVSRFYFDKKLDDLGEVITQKEAQIMAYEDVEAEMRKVLAKQRSVEMLQNGGLDFVSKVENLTQAIPMGTVLESFSLSKSGLTILGKAQSEYEFAQFVYGIKKMPKVKIISLGETSFDQTTGGVKFSIQINYK